MNLRAKTMHDTRWSHLHFVGHNFQQGTYLLRLVLQEDTRLRIGKNKIRAPILLPKGTYMYIGSALGTKSASSLPYRLIRHCKRSSGTHHTLIHELLAFFEVHHPRSRKPWSATLTTPKTLHWNIDYIVEPITTQLLEIYAYASSLPCELIWSMFLNESANIHVPYKGLGANDLPGVTNFLKVPSDPTWWSQIFQELLSLCEISHK